MALQVWLPLNGDLHNQGLNNITITNNGATVNDNGKIGKCYYFNGTDARLSLPSYILNYPISICAWIKGETITDSTTEYIFSYNTASGGTDGHKIGFGTYQGKLTIWQGKSTASYNTALENNKWYHIAAIVTTTSYILYLNGIPVITDTRTMPTVNSEFFTIGARSNATGGGVNGAKYYFKGYINDARIYDHALSAKEVEEISKGLVLHYKLNDAYIENTTNLVTTEDGLSNICYNGATKQYDYGTKTDMYKTVGTFQKKFCTKVYMGTAGKSAYPYVYFDSFNAKGTEIQTISFDYFPTIQDTLIAYSYNGTYNFSYTSNYSNKGSNTNASQIIIPVNINQWNHITITAQKYDTINITRGIGYIRIGSTSHTSATTNYWLFANVQVENKDHATGYAGIAGVRNNYIIYDSSGYGNNGIIVGSLEVTTPSPRYSCATKFDGDSTAIQTPNLTTMITDKNYTISCWTYKTSIGTKNYQTIYGGPSGFELEARSNSSTNPLFRIHNWGGGTTAYEFGKWYHFCFVHNDNESKLYINGELKITGTSVAIPSGNYFIGAWSTSAKQNYDGNISDFRIYATALTAAQIKELYMTSMRIDGTNIVPRDLE